MSPVSARRSPAGPPGSRHGSPSRWCGSARCAATAAPGPPRRAARAPPAGAQSGSVASVRTDECGTLPVNVFVNVDLLRCTRGAEEDHVAAAADSSEGRRLAGGNSRGLDDRIRFRSKHCQGRARARVHALHAPADAASRRDREARGTFTSCTTTSRTPCACRTWAASSPTRPAPRTTTRSGLPRRQERRGRGDLRERGNVPRFPAGRSSGTGSSDAIRARPHDHVSCRPRKSHGRRAQAADRGAAGSNPSDRGETGAMRILGEGDFQVWTGVPVHGELALPGLTSVRCGRTSASSTPAAGSNCIRSSAFRMPVKTTLEPFMGSLARIFHEGR